jgi:hypothetical protein
MEDAITDAKNSIVNLMPTFDAETIRTKDEEDELTVLLTVQEPSNIQKERITELNAKKPYVPPPTVGGRRRRRRSQKQYGGSKRRSRSGSRRRRNRKSRKGGRK